MKKKTNYNQIIPGYYDFIHKKTKVFRVPGTTLNLDSFLKRLTKKLNILM